MIIAIIIIKINKKNQTWIVKVKEQNAKILNLLSVWSFQQSKLQKVKW